MKKLKIIDWLLIILAVMLLIIALSGSVFAGWDQPQITLKPGESWTGTVEAPAVPENAEKLLGEIESLHNSIVLLTGRIDLLSSQIRSLEAWAENLLDRIALLEKTSKEDWSAAIENLRTELESSLLMASENSGISREEFEIFQAALNGRLTVLETDVRQEIEDARDEAVKYSAIAAALAVLIGVGIVYTVLHKKPTLERGTKPSRKRAEPKTPEKIEPQASW